MKNQYMFFEEQLFEEFDLSGYKKSDIRISKTSVHIYEFECIDSQEKMEEEQAKDLDQLTERLTEKYGELFQVVYSESSQYFCKQLYPLVVLFETRLRYALYISTALFKNGNVNKDSFEIGVKKKSRIEKTDFGQIYEALFTDVELQGKINQINGQKLTKADLIKEIEALDECSLWEQIVGSGYDYIVENFLDIKNYRNDIMHNRLLKYEQYVKEKDTLQKALAELKRVIDDKLLVNKSDYSNKTNIMEVLGGIIIVVGAIALAIDKYSKTEFVHNMMKRLEKYKYVIDKSSALLEEDKSVLVIDDEDI